MRETYQQNLNNQIRTEIKNRSKVIRIKRNIMLSHKTITHNNSLA